MKNISYPYWEEVRAWNWRNLRTLSVRVQISFAPWSWQIGTYRTDDHTGGYLGFMLGPIAAELIYGIGNRGDESPWRSRMALSELEAWKRSKQV